MTQIKFCGIAVKSSDDLYPKLLIYHSYSPEINNILAILAQKIDIYVDHKKAFEPSAETKWHAIQYIVDDEIIYFSVTTASFPIRLCFRLLDKVREEFQVRGYRFLTDKDRLNFENLLKRLIDFYADDKNADQIREVNTKIEQITDIMTENIKSVLKKGEDLELLVTEVSRLETNADEFKVRARKVKCAMIIHNLKWCIFMLVVIVICLLILLGIIAGIVYYFFFYN